MLSLFHRSMASFHDSTQSRMMNHGLSAVPSEISRFSQLMSPSTVKQFAPWDRVDGSTPVPTVSRTSFNCVLKGFALGASLLPSLRAEYKVSKLALRFNGIQYACVSFFLAGGMVTFLKFFCVTSELYPVSIFSRRLEESQDQVALGRTASLSWPCHFTV